MILAKIGMIGQGTTAMTVEMFAGMGVPAVITYLVIIAETVGAVALILGLCTRFCAASLALIMAVAIYFMFGSGYFAGYVTPLLFLIMFLPLIRNGAGGCSVDREVVKKMK
mgnify:FL=1